jgi:hypothetical protein
MYAHLEALNPRAGPVASIDDINTAFAKVGMSNNFAVAFLLLLGLRRLEEHCVVIMHRIALWLHLQGELQAG